jgi:hypothetical protein
MAITECINISLNFNRKIKRGKVVMDCIKHDEIVKVVNDIKIDVAELKQSVKEGWAVIRKNEKEVGEVKEMHGMFLKLEQQMISVNEKVDNQIRTSNENTQTIIQAMIDNKKSLEDRILDVIVPAIVYGGIGMFVINFL